VCIDILFLLSVVANLRNWNSVLNLFVCSPYPLMSFFFALFLRFAGGSNTWDIDWWTYEDAGGVVSYSLRADYFAGSGAECVKGTGVVFCFSTLQWSFFFALFLRFPADRNTWDIDWWTYEDAGGVVSYSLRADYFAGSGAECVKGAGVFFCLSRLGHLRKTCLHLIHLCFHGKEFIIQEINACLGFFQLRVVNALCLQLFDQLRVVNALCLQLFDQIRVVNALCLQLFDQIRVVNALCLQLFKFFDQLRFVDANELLRVFLGVWKSTIDDVAWFVRKSIRETDRMLFAIRRLKKNRIAREVFLWKLNMMINVGHEVVWG